MRLGARKAALASGLALAGSLALLLSGCGTGVTTTKVSDSKQILHLQDSESTDIKSFDPPNTGDVASVEYVSVVFPGLVVLNDKLTPIPWAAQTLPSVSTDGLTWTFKIRPGLKWSDGSPIDAADYAFSMNRAENPCNHFIAAYYLYAIKDAAAFNAPTNCNTQTNTVVGSLKTLIGDSIIVQDPQTLVIKLAAPASYFLDAMTYPTSYAVPQSLVNQYGGSWTNHLPDNGGFGGDMFKVTQWDHVHDLILSRNENFWGQKPILSKVDVKFYKSADAAYTAYHAGQSDVGVAPTAQLTKAKTQKTFHQIAVEQIDYIAMNWQQKPFDSLIARQAFAIAIDKDTLATNIWKGTVTPTNHIVPSGMPGYNPKLLGPDGTTSVKGNPAKATQLLAEYATQTGCGTATDFSKCPPVTLTIYSGVPELVSEADALQAMWTQAFPGYKINISTIDWNTLLSDTAAHKLQFWILGWAEDYPDPQDWLSANLTCASFYNAGFACDKQADALMNTADANLNQTQRLQQYQQAEQILVTKVAWLPTDQATTWWETNPHLQGFSVTAGDLIPRESWQNMYITA